MPANQRDSSVVPNAVVDTRMLKRAILARTSQLGIRGVLETLLEYLTQVLTDPERPVGEARRRNFGQKPAAGNCTRHIKAFQLLQAKFMRETPSSPLTRRREVGGLAPQTKKRSGGEGGVGNQGSRRAQVSGGSSVQKMIARFSAVTQKEIKEPTQVYREQGSTKQIGRGPVLSAMIGKFEAIATVHKGSNFTCPKTDPKPNVSTTAQGANEHKRCQDSEKQAEDQVSVKKKKSHSCEDGVKDHHSGQQAKSQDSWLQDQGEVPEQQAGLSRRGPLYSSKAVEQSSSGSEEGTLPQPAKSPEVFSHPLKTTLPESSNPDPSTDPISPSGLPQHQAHGSETKPSLSILHLPSTADPTVHPTQGESPPRMSPPCSQSASPDNPATNSPVSRGLSLQPDLSSTTDKMEDPHPSTENSTQKTTPLLPLPEPPVLNSPVSRGLSLQPDLSSTTDKMEDPHPSTENSTQKTTPLLPLPEPPVLNSPVSRGLSLQLDLSSTNNRMAGPHLIQLCSHGPQQHLPRYSLPRTCGPLTPEQDCAPMSTESDSRSTSAKATFPCEQPAVPESPSPSNTPKTTLPLLPISEPPAPEPAPSSPASGDLFITTAPAPLLSENLSPKTASPLLSSEPLMSDTGASSQCTQLSFQDQMTEGQQSFPWETQRGGDMQTSSQTKPNVTLEIMQVSSEALLENNPPYNYHSNLSTANQNLLSDKTVHPTKTLPRSGPPRLQSANPGYQAPNSLVSRGLSLQLDLSSTTDKMADPQPGQLLSHVPQENLLRCSLPQTHGPLTPERDCAATSTDSDSRPTSPKTVPESPSSPSAPKTASLLPISEPPAPKPAPSTLTSGDLFNSTTPAPLLSDNLSSKTASPLPTSEPLTSDTGASSQCTHLPLSPGSCITPAHLDQVTEGQQRFPWETERGGDMQNSFQNKPNDTLEITQVSSEALLENNPSDYRHSNQTTANQNLLSDKAQNDGSLSKYRTRNYEEACIKKTFKPKTIRFADTFRF